jgi:dipeptidyl aminopeptidase/acylaminoacyl peptidase
MARKWKLRLLALLALLVLLVLVPNGLAYIQARGMTHFVESGERTPPPGQMPLLGKLRVLLLGVHIPHPANTRTPEDVGLTFETRRFPGEAGDLEAWVIPAEPAHGWILLFHGYAGNKGDLLEIASRFHDLGWSAALVDFRGSGGSRGDRTTVGWTEARDVASTVRWAREALHEPAPVLYGFSMGAAAVLRAVAVEGIKPRAVIAEASFDRMLTTVQRRFHMMHLPSWPMANLLVFWGGLQNGFDGFAHNPVDYAARIVCPTLVLQGAMDDRVTVGEAKAIHAALRGYKVLHVFPDADHEASLGASPEDWAAVIAPFLARATGNPLRE